MKDQSTVLLNHMGAGHKITRYEAILNFGIQNITARIADIRNHGIDVKTKEKRDPTGKRYAQYYITAGEVEHALNSKKLGRVNGQLYLK
jgi:hypothetical protein